MPARTARLGQIQRRSNAARSAQTRDQLIEGAIRALREIGFARTTTATICAHARVTTGALHHHFATKEDLLFAVLDRLSVDVSAQLDGFFDFTGPLAATAERAVQRLWSVYGGKRYRAVWEITIGFSSERRLRTAMTRQRNQATDALIERWCRGLDLARHEREEIAGALRFTLIAIRGLFLDTYLDFDRRHFQQQLSILSRAVAERLENILGQRRRLARVA